MTLHKLKKTLFFGIGIGLIVFLFTAPSVHAGAECASLGGFCDDSGQDPLAKLDQIGNSTANQEHTSVKWPEKSRTMRWNTTASGLEDEERKALAINTEASEMFKNEPKFNFELEDVSAEPNPVRSGSTATITASFRKKQHNSIGNLSDQEIKLTIKSVGCSTCGFEGFALGAANITGNKFGIVQLSSSNRIAAQANDSVLRCSAIINSSDGYEAARISLLRTSGERYVGIWNADVAPGMYKVSIGASVLDSVETFSDVLEIDVQA